MVYSVPYNCARKHTSHTNDYIPHVSSVKTRPETTTTRNGLKDTPNAVHSCIDLRRPHMGEPHASTGFPRTHKYHYILNEVVR